MNELDTIKKKIKRIEKRLSSDHPPLKWHKMMNRLNAAYSELDRAVGREVGQPWPENK